MSSSRPLPRRRKDLELATEDGRGLVIDRRIGAIHPVSPAELAAVRALDGKRDVAAVARVAALSPARVRALVERLDAQHLLETPRAARALERHDEDVEKRWLDTPDKNAKLRRLPVADGRTHWDCHGCGMCCRGLSVPLSPAEIDRIEPTLYEDVLRGRSFHVPWASGGGDAVERVLRQVGSDDRCIFLAPDGRCWVHARQGAAAKPDTCQLFPLATIVTARGPRLTLRIACGSLHESHEDGTPLDDYAASCLELERREPCRGIYGAKLDGEKVAFDRYVEIESRLGALLDEHGAGPDFVRAALDVVPGASIARHEVDRRALGRAIQQRLRADETAPSPLIGWFAGKLRRSVAMQRGLAALSAGREAPVLLPASRRFVAGTFRQVLWACEAYKVPDIQVGLRGLLLVLELILHTVGERGSLAAASRATRVWWMAGFEDGELTPILWDTLRSQP